MLKTNSKKALGNIRAYILENADSSNYDGRAFSDWKAAARFVYDCFRQEKDGDNRRMTEYALFEEWASGLPSSFDFCYWYNRPERFPESKAEKLLTTLIYNQIKKAVA